MELWLATAHFPGRAAEAASRAEAEGFDGISFGDTQCIAADPYVGLTAAANATTRLKLAVGVTNPITRFSAVTACAIASVHAISNGRAVLGIGRGDSSVSKVNKRAASVAEFERYVADLQGYLSGREVDQDGKVSRLEWLAATNLPKVPVDVAATGPVTIAAGARQADRLTFNVGADRERIRDGIALARRARRDAGLPADGLSFGAYLMVAPHPDAQIARNMVKGVTAIYARFQAMPGHPTDSVAPEKAAVIRAVGETYEASHHGHAEGRHVAALSSDFIDDFAVVGSAQHCAEKLDGLLRLGLDRLIMVGPNHTVAPDQFAESRRLLATVILPELRRGRQPVSQGGFDEVA